MPKPIAIDKFTCYTDYTKLIVTKEELKWQTKAAVPKEGVCFPRCKGQAPLYGLQNIENERRNVLYHILQS